MVGFGLIRGGEIREYYNEPITDKLSHSLKSLKWLMEDKKITNKYKWKSSDITPWEPSIFWSQLKTQAVFLKNIQLTRV